MGMDVYGKKPRSEKGKYFRNNCWWWRPLWQYCGIIAPKVTKKVKYAQYNSGDGLGRVDSEKLSDILTKKIESGEAKKYEVERKKALESLPLTGCKICDSTGRRKEPPQIGAGDSLCNGCYGKGKIKQAVCAYPFAVGNAKKFAEFLKDCGGFSIY